MKILLPGKLVAGAGLPIYRGYSAAWAHHGYKPAPTQGLDDWFDIVESLSANEKYSIMVDDFTLSSYYSLAVDQQTAHEFKLANHAKPIIVRDSKTGLKIKKTFSQMTVNEIQEGSMAVYSAALEVIQKSEKCYIFVQPTKFPPPWGTHANFICGYSSKAFLDGAGLEALKYLNGLDNVHLWTWVEQTPEVKDGYYKEWKQINYVPLAFDSISYKKESSDKNNHDVCYVGGWANNGFNEKGQIMRNHFKHLMKSKLDCGIFINKNLSHEQENRVLYNSNVALNIHDKYQRILGLDTNERTFKSLGLTGILVSDTIKAIENLFPDLPMYNTEDEMMTLIDRYLSNKKLAADTRDHYRNKIMEGHTYIHRVEKLINL